ncbi:MAG: carboxyl-terminal processing protease [Patescibacteria group bacterium]|nr:carboxyl-terminal processing protease [Patescibacteria group bacterium]
MKISSKIVCLVFVLISFVSGFYYHEYLFQERYKRAYSDENIDLSILKKTLDQIYLNYVDPSKINLEKMTYGAAAGMVDALGDPYTEFFDPEGATSIQESISGKFEGIGLQIGIRDKQLTAISPIKGTPADRSGIRPGDKIIFVDEKPTSNLSVNEAVDIIRGPKGTKVVLTILRDGENFDVEITRDVINVPTVEVEMLENNIALLGLYHFSNSTNQDFRKAVFEIINSDAKGIILDLRSNPGGLVNQAIDVSGWLLNRNDLVMIEKSKDGIEKEFRANGSGDLMNYPTIILINEGTASASEILAGALKDNRNLMIIGEKSFGKGTVQKLISIYNNSMLKVTIAEWLTPNRNIINDNGITPDIEVELTIEDYEQQKDPQLEKAIEEIIKKINI